MTARQQEKTIRDLKVRVSIYRGEVLKDRQRLKTLSTQYEAVVKEWKKMYNDLITNAPKLFLVYLKRKWDKKRGKIDAE